VTGAGVVTGVSGTTVADEGVGVGGRLILLRIEEKSSPRILFRSPPSIFAFNRGKPLPNVAVALFAAASTLIEFIAVVTASGLLTYSLILINNSSSLLTYNNE
jgi:hypothetical protein